MNKDRCMTTDEHARQMRDYGSCQECGMGEDGVYDHVDTGGPCCIGYASGSDHSPDCTLSPNYNGRGAEFPSYE